MNKTYCRFCKNSDLHCFLDLGFHPHSDQFRATLDVEEAHYPLRMVRCRECGFVQLDYVVPPQDLYQKDYLYESSITETGNRHWKEFAETVSAKIGLKPSEGVIDIGSNDGTLLTKFKALGHEGLRDRPVQGTDGDSDFTRHPLRERFLLKPGRKRGSQGDR